MNNKKMIESRANGGIGLNAQIMSLINDISLGYHYFRIAKILREAMLVNSMLFSANAWYDITEANLRSLEQVDESLLRQILKAHSKTPTEALYLELGCIPIRYILKTRRINYLHYILKLDKSELLWKVFEAQMNNPTKGDWYLQVVQDLKDYDISTDLNKLTSFSKDSFKKLVKSKQEIAALKYLNNIKSKHSKMVNLKYENIELQPYLNNETVYPQVAQNIFKWRTRMQNVTKNFSNGSEDLACKFGCSNFDSQEHLLNCIFIQSKFSNSSASTPQYNDLFSRDVSKVKEIVTKLSQALQVREKLLEKKQSTYSWREIFQRCLEGLTSAK